MINRPVTKENFNEYLKIMPSGCIEWQRGRQKYGHGRAWYENRKWLVHRLAWIFANGPIPEGLYVCHKCDNPPCCNVDHLFLGTHLDNMADRERKGRNPVHKGEENGGSKLTEEQVIEILNTPKVLGSGRALAKRFGVTDSAIYLVRKGKNWAYLRKAA